jgi:hypothetical protein
MASPRNVSHPIVRTYLKKTQPASGKTTFHVRILSPDHDLDRRGTGKTISIAMKKALAGLPRPR